MSFTAPFLLPCFWTSGVPWVNGFIGETMCRADGFIVVDRQLSFEDLVDKVSQCCCVDLRVTQMSFTLVYTDLAGRRNYVFIMGNEFVGAIYMYALYLPELYVMLEPTAPNLPSSQVIQPSYEFEGSSQGVVLAGKRVIDVGEPSNRGHLDLNFFPESQNEGEDDSDDPTYVMSSNCSGSVRLEDINADVTDSCSASSVDPSSSDVEVEVAHHVPIDHYVYSVVCDEPDQSPPSLYSKLFDGDVDNIVLGTLFESKVEVQNAITSWSAKRGVSYRTTETKKKKWAVECATRADSYPQELLHGARCGWKMRATQQVGSGLWKITVWTPQHNCAGGSNASRRNNVTSREIGVLVMEHVKKEIGYKVKLVQLDVKKAFHVDVSYSKAWHGRRKAIEAVYGSWERNVRDLPMYMAALQVANPGTYVKFKFGEGTKHLNQRVLKYVFWAFAPCIATFRHCCPVISVDGTHLRGAYKGKLLVAVCKTSNNNIMPLAFALVDEETTLSWTFFLNNLKKSIIKDRFTCVISDRHLGIIAAMKLMLQRYPSYGVHRFCLEHIKANLLTHIRKKGLKEACQILGTELNETKYWAAWSRLNEENPQAAEYLQQISPEMWTLFQDGGHRWGLSTTNISESYNNVLKGARRLPIRAMVECTFEKCAYIFRRDLPKINACNTALAPHPMAIYMANMANSTRLSVTQYTNTFVVLDGKGNQFEVKPLEGCGECSCGVWQNKRFPCSHVIAVASYLSADPLKTVDRYYTMDGWRRQYSGNFHPVMGCGTWPTVGWALEADEVRLVRHSGPGSRTVNRRLGAMDYSRRRGSGSGRSETSCTRCGNTNHVRRRCPMSHPPTDRVAVRDYVD